MPTSALWLRQLELVHRVGTEVPTGQGGMEKLVTGGVGRKVQCRCGVVNAHLKKPCGG